MADLSVNSLENYPKYQIDNSFGGNVRRVEGTPYQYQGPTTGSVETASGYSSRAVDNFPRLTKVDYEENIPAQAGYGPSKSHFSWIG